MKIKVCLDIPDGDCRKCPYYTHSSFEYYYQCYEEHDKCRLFGNVELQSKDGKIQRCVACQSCEVLK